MMMMMSTSDNDRNGGGEDLMPMVLNYSACDDTCVCVCVCVSCNGIW